MKVAVLGAGPAGLFAAHAAAMTNNDVRIFSKKRKSYMRGAQYLHAPVPMLSYNNSMFMVNYKLDGDVDGYRRKIYKDPRTKVSVESLVGQHMAWDLRAAYEEAWNMYVDYVYDCKITLDLLREAFKEDKPDLVVSSLPMNMLCEDPTHMFVSETVWVTETYRGTQDNTVLCSGNADEPWYRTSRIHGWDNTEYPEDKKPPLSSDKVHEVVKPVKATCTCLQEALGDIELLTVGRYGTWTKGVLSHRAFYDTFERLDGSSTKESNQ